MLAELAREAGIPDGVVNVVTGGREAGAALVAHPGVAKIGFTVANIRAEREIGEVECATHY